MNAAGRESGPSSTAVLAALASGTIRALTRQATVPRVRATAQACPNNDAATAGSSDLAARPKFPTSRDSAGRQPTNQSAGTWRCPGRGVRHRRSPAGPSRRSVSSRKR